MASRVGSRTFRLATINVHSFTNASRAKNNVDELVSILRPLDLDLLAVEEVEHGRHWTSFCEKLAFTHSAFDPTYGHAHGNGIASRYPIKSRVTRPTDFSSPGGKRSMMQFQLEGDHPFTIDRLFAVTHLDHMDEDARVAQIKHFQPHRQNVDVLIGDMNALTREDYSDVYYQQIVAGKREASGWEKPRFDLTQLITEQWNYQDAFRLVNPRAQDQNMVTCAYGTRIDYIYLRPRSNDRWKLTRCSIINTQPATDHNAVFAEFEECLDSDDETPMD